MNNSTYLYFGIKGFFSLFMLFSALGELSFHPTVVESMHALQMPLYLLYFLGISKILGLLAIWWPKGQQIRTWAYAGFSFDFIGAIFGFILTASWIIPDLIMAPLALMLCISSYWLEQGYNAKDSGHIQLAF